jgi:hypothetical protein
MRETTQAHIREQGTEIAGLRGMLQVLAADTFVSKEAIQERIAVAEEKLTEIQNKLTEIEFSEDLEWLSDEAVIKSLRERGIDERSIAGEDELAEAKVLRCLERKRERSLKDKA